MVDQLLVDPRTPKNLARVWRRMMIPSNGPENYSIATQLFEPWLIEQFAANTHYNELARKVLVATPQVGMMRVIVQPGQEPPSPSPSGYMMAVGQTPDAMAGASTRFFLGVSLNCAKCHDHPFAKWKQQDFWGMAAFFANRGTGVGQIQSEQGRQYGAIFLGGEKATIPTNKLGPEVLVDWMTSPKNSNFGATAVNRIWQHLYGRGAVSEIDDLDRVSAEKRTFFLDELARRFAATDYDVRWLMASLCKNRNLTRESSCLAAFYSRLSPLSSCRFLALSGPVAWRSPSKSSPSTKSPSTSLSRSAPRRKTSHAATASWSTSLTEPPSPSPRIPARRDRRRRSLLQSRPPKFLRHRPRLHSRMRAFARTGITSQLAEPGGTGEQESLKSNLEEIARMLSGLIKGLDNAEN